MAVEKPKFATGLDANHEPAADESMDNWLKQTFGHNMLEIKESYREKRSQGEKNEREYSQEEIDKQNNKAE